MNLIEGYLGRFNVIERKSLKLYVVYFFENIGNIGNIGSFYFI